MFYAEAVKGYIIKVMIDALYSGGISRGIFVLNQTGISLKQEDSLSTILYDVNIPSSELLNYRCTKKTVISVNLKHLQVQLKSVKKKDSVTMYIDEKVPGKLNIIIRLDGAKGSQRFETKGIAFQTETDYKIIDPFDGEYGAPMIIGSSDFQKIKQMTAMSKIIYVVMQKSNYLFFNCDSGVVMDSGLGFGELYDEEETCEFCENTKEMCECTCDKCSEWLCDCECPRQCKKCEMIQSECECVCEACNEWLCECWCECAECSEWLVECKCARMGIFRAEYYSTSLNKLVKLPGLCAQMQFYAPQIPQYPLMIEMTAVQGGNSLGKVRVYIKDIKQIIYEASLQKETDNVIQLRDKKGK